MKLTIFGATGTIGKILVEKALSEGNIVRAYVRTPAKMALTHQNLEIITGDLTDYDKINRSVEGADAVISTIGPSIKGKFSDYEILDGYRTILWALKVGGVKRFITIASPGINFKHDHFSIITKIPVFVKKMFCYRAYKEIVRIGKVVTSSELDWTIVRFIRPKNTPPTGNVRVTFGDNKIKFGISRADIADFLLKQTTDLQYIRSMPIIGS